MAEPNSDASTASTEKGGGVNSAGGTIFDLSNLWAAVPEIAPAECQAYCAAYKVHARVLAETEPLVALDAIKQKEQALWAADNVNKIKRAAVEMATAVVTKANCEVARDRLLRIEQAKVFATLPPVFAAARKVAQLAREQIARAEKDYFAQFGVAHERTALSAHVERFEREIDYMKMAMEKYSFHFALPLVPRIGALLPPVEQAPDELAAIDINNPATDPRLRFLRMWRDKEAAEEQWRLDAPKRLAARQRRLGQVRGAPGNLVPASTADNVQPSNFNAVAAFAPK